MNKLSDKEDPSELFTIAKMKDDDLKRFMNKESFLFIIFDRPISPGNLGTLIRSADAFQADGVIVIGHAADLYDPQTIRASMRSFFSVNSVRVFEHVELLAWIKELKEINKELELIGSSAKAATSLYDYSFPKAKILVMGNETHGMSSFFPELCDVSLSIPMNGTASSLNVGSAASIFLYEMNRKPH